MSDWSEDVPHVCSAACIQSPAETLALIAEHRLTVEPMARDQWSARWDPGDAHLLTISYGPTIGDAVRACVERIKASR